jgi:hypothetical protein
MMIILDIWGPGLAYAFGIFLVIILLFLLNFTLFLIYLFKNKYKFGALFTLFPVIAVTLFFIFTEFDRDSRELSLKQPLIILSIFIVFQILFLLFDRRKQSKSK